jgi:uncharacterized integral membrane protein
MAMEMLSLSPALVKDSMLAIAAMTQYEAFDTTMYTAGLLWFVMAVVSAATGGSSAKTGLQRFLIAYLILLAGAKTQLDMVITNPITAESYAVSDVPAGLAVLGWGTSAIAKTFKDIYETEMTPPGVGGVLTRNGVGRGLAVLTGLEGVPWSDRSRTVGNTGTNFTDIEQSIDNYLENCFNPMMTSEGGGIDRWSTFHSGGDTGSLSGVWQRVRAPVVLGTVVYVNSATQAGTNRTCTEAWTDINGVITSTAFENALEEDAIDHYAKQLAAMSMPGASVTLTTGTSTALVRAQLKAEADEMLTALFGGTGMRSRILFLDKMNKALLNAYGASPRGQVMEPQGRLASAWDDAKRQADLSMAAQGDWWVRNAKPMTQYMELIALGFLPIMLFMMFASPNGGKAMMGIVFVYFWIQTWPIAYIILNHASMGSMVATFDQFLANTSSFGMEDLYGLWDQARHSYAVSQSLLGMTPLITGMMLTGSVMMLTKMASGIGSAENLDETRIHNNTESSAPIYQGQSQTTMMTDPNGRVVQNQDATRTGTDVNVQDTLNKQVTDAQKESQTAQTAYNNQVANAKTKAVQDMSTEQLINTISRKEGYQNGFDSSAVTSNTIMDSQAQSWVDKQAAKAAMDLSASYSGSLGTKGSKFLNDLKNGDEAAQSALKNYLSADQGAKAGIAGSAGISTELATALTNEFRKSEEARFALSEIVKADEAFSDMDTLTELNAASETLTDQDMEQLAKSQSEMQAKERAYTSAQSRASAVSSAATITEGRSWLLTDNVAKEMLMATSQLDGEEKKAKMREIAEDKGLSAANASKLTNILGMKNWDQHAPSNAGGHSMGAGVLAQMRDVMGMDEVAKFLVANEERYGQTFKEDLDGIDKPKDEVDTSGVADIGQVEGQVAAAVRTTPLPNASAKLTGDNANEAAALKAEVESKTDFVEKQKAFRDEMAGKLDKIQARDDGEYSAFDLLGGGAQELNIGAFPELLGSDAKMKAEERVLEMISLAGVAAQFAQDNASSAINGYDSMSDPEKAQALQQLKQRDVDLVMSNLLRGNDKDEYDRMISAGDNDTASQYLQDKLSAAGLQTDAASVEEFSGQIKSTLGLHEINSLDVFERIGNLLQGVDNDKVETLRNELRSQVGNMSEGNSYGGLSYADNKAEVEYDRIKDSLSERREDGEARITDVLLSELMSLAAYAAQDNKGVEFQQVLDKVNNEASGLEAGFSQGLMNLAASGKGHEGLSIDRSEIEKIFDASMGEGTYEGYRAQMSNELKAQVNGDEQAILKGKIAEVQDKMTPSSPAYSRLDDEVRKAIDGMSLDSVQRDVMAELARTERGAALAAASKYELHSPESKQSVDVQKIVDEVAGEGSYQEAQFQVMEKEAEAFKGDLEKMTNEFEEKYGAEMTKQFDEWKNEFNYQPS